jgi:hypothetical protein
MNKLAILCLLGVASAHKRPSFDNRVDHRQNVADIFDQHLDQEENQSCPISTEKKLRWEKYSIKVASATYREAVRGLYQERSAVISDQCFGDWINDDYIPVGKILKKAREDPW